MSKPISSTSSLSLTQSKGCEQHVFDHKRGKVNLVLDLCWISIFPLEESNKRTEKARCRSPSSWTFNLFAVPTMWSVSSTTRHMSCLIKRSCSLISGKKEKKGNWKKIWKKETHTHCVIQLTPKTVLEISSNEGREWGSDCKHIWTSWMYGCGQSDFREGRCSWLVILVRSSVTLENDSSE